MRNRTKLVLIVLLSLATVSVAIAGPTQLARVSKTAIQRLDELNEILDEILEGLIGGTMGPEEFADKLVEAFAAFDDVLAEMPVAGLLFADVFSALYDVMDSLLLAADMFDAGAPGPYLYFAAILDAKVAKDSLKWDASGGLLQRQRECSQGRALVTVYPGFDCSKLMNKMRELFNAGKCVTVAWREAEGYAAPPLASNNHGPNAARLYACLGGAFQTGPTFEMRQAATGDEAGFTEEHVFGDPDASAHVSQTPHSPHDSHVDSALVTDVIQGQPVRIDPDAPLASGDVIKPWVKVQNVCSPTEVRWDYYSQSGTLVMSDGQILDPADYNQTCLSSFSTSGWTTLRQDTFGEGGRYTVELWLGGQHTANLNFQMAGRGPMAPYAYNDFYAMDEDTVLNGTGSSVLSNDLDPNGDPLMGALTDPPSHGTLDLNQGGTFTYTPDRDFYGVDWFSYKAVDTGALFAEGEVTILVNPVNDGPIVRDDVFELQVAEGQTEVTVPAPGVMLNDRDPDNDRLQVILADAPPVAGFVLQPDGGFTIEDPLAWTESPAAFSFRYTATDPSGLEATGEVEVRIESGTGDIT